MNAPLTTVIGPQTALSECLVNRLASDLISALFPTPRGPTTPTTIGGRSSPLRSTRGTCSFFWSRSAVRRASRSAFPFPKMAKAYSSMVSAPFCSCNEEVTHLGVLATPTASAPISLGAHLPLRSRRPMSLVRAGLVGHVQYRLSISLLMSTRRCLPKQITTWG